MSVARAHPSYLASAFPPHAGANFLTSGILMRRIRPPHCDLQAQAAGRFAYASGSAVDGGCLGRSPTWCFTIARAAGQHANPRASPRLRQLRQSGLLSQRRIGRQRAPRQPDLWGAATADALHRVRSSRRRRWPVLAATWLIGPPHWIGRQSGIAFLHPLRLTPANDRMGNVPC